jgi:serine phosphatase RsbU (regulator of sigma subunit)
VALLYTDGLYSVPAKDGGRLSPESLAELLPQEFVSAEDFLNQTINELGARVRGGHLPDDVAAVALRRL